MRVNRLGWTDLELTNIGLGTFAIGGPDWEAGWGPQEDEESISAIRRALELGINWIDTAPAYGLGRAERVVCEALRDIDPAPMIATKCGLLWNEERKIENSLKKDSIRREVDDSLKRLHIDVIDLYQIHWPVPDLELEEAWTAIAELVDEGKVRYAGVCNCDIEQLERLQSINRVASLQPPYSMIDRRVEDRVLEYCKSHQIGVIPYSPMQRGLLTGKYTKDSVGKMDPRDHRRNEPYFQEPELSIHLKLVERLGPVVERNKRSMAQLSLSWVLRRDEITAAIVGARSPSQIEQTVLAGDWELDKEDLLEIDKALKEHESTLKKVKQ